MTRPSGKSRLLRAVSDARCFTGDNWAAYVTSTPCVCVCVKFKASYVGAFGSGTRAFDKGDPRIFSLLIFSKSRSALRRPIDVTDGQGFTPK